MGEVLLDIILLLVVSGALRKFLGGMMAGMRRSPNGPAPGPRQRGDATVHMERDPVCGTFVVPERAILLAVGRDRLYFCSQACCERYRAKIA